jgi:hypothetical protein
VDRLFHGSASLELLIESAPSGLARPGALIRLQRLQGWMDNYMSLSRSVSVVTYLREVDRVRTGKSEGRLPTKNVYLTLLRMKRIAPEIFFDWLDATFSVGRMSARLPLSAADRVAAQLPALEAYLAGEFSGSDLHITTTGYVKLMNNMRLYLLNSQFQSLVLAAISVTLVMCWMLRSFVLGLLSMIPNIIPVLLGGAVMGALRIRLDPGTVMIASVALGLVVDGTCHYLSYVRREMLSGAGVSEALLTSMLHTGRPIILSSVILTIGFSALTAGSFAPTIYFGFVMSVIVVLALVADLLLTPAVMFLLGRMGRPIAQRTP